jgi:hypothetical protein
MVRPTPQGHKMIDFYLPHPNSNGTQGMFNVGNYSKIKNGFLVLIFHIKVKF